MKLINMRLKDEPPSISIEAEGHVWDIHDLYDFEGVRQNINDRTVILLWRPSIYATPPLYARAFEIVFAEVDYFEITPRDSEIPDFGEDTCLNGLLRILPEENTSELIANGYPIETDFPEERFHLWFMFRGGQNIRIGAETAIFRELISTH
ncbi:MAG: hypothetical protein H7308_19390 [Chthonomonadaceae bacterium]|nr:hypothetical protein [Chthonomonadaceae bacterium]